MSPSDKIVVLLYLSTSPVICKTSILSLDGVPAETVMSCVATYVISSVLLLLSLLCILTWDLKVLGYIVKEEGVMSFWRILRIKRTGFRKAVVDSSTIKVWMKWKAYGSPPFFKFKISYFLFNKGKIFIRVWGWVNMTEFSKYFHSKKLKLHEWLYLNWFMWNRCTWNQHGFFSVQGDLKYS